MYCNYCGTEVDINANFCTKCGKRLENYPKTVNQEGSITFARENQFYGVIVPVKIFMDGNLVVTINAGNEAKVPASIGKHKIAFDLWSGNAAYDVDITPEHPNIKVTFKIGIGAITSKPKIVSITNL